MKAVILKASVYTDLDGKTRQFESTTIEDLFKQIHACLGPDYFGSEDISITMEDGSLYFWDFGIARNYFDKGRISFEQMLELMKEKDSDIHTDLPIEVSVYREVMKSNFEDDSVAFQINVESKTDSSLDGRLYGISEEAARQIYILLGRFFNTDNNVSDGKE